MSKKKSAKQSQAQADAVELETAFDAIRNDLVTIAQVRLDRRLKGRVDATDVVQDVYLQARKRHAEFLQARSIPLSGWLRFLTIQSVHDTHRFHLGSAKRTAQREVHLSSDASVVRILELISDSLTTPHSAALKKEMHATILELVARLSDTDQQILRLRHVDRLTNKEVSETLGITVSNASKRHMRALMRLKKLGEGKIL